MWQCVEKEEEVEKEKIGKKNGGTKLEAKWVGKEEQKKKSIGGCCGCKEWCVVLGIGKRYGKRENRGVSGKREER